MVLPEQRTKVLIIGAGPSGLMMAAQLLRHGVQPVIIDNRLGPTDQSKALAVQARTLEIYRQMGIADRAIAEGKKASGVTFNQKGKPIAALSFEGIGNEQTPFPFLHFYQQSKNERLLLDYLTQNCCPVYWDTTLISLQQTVNEVIVELKNTNSEHTLTCDWLVGADGAHSIVRKQSGIDFKGDTYAHQFYLADGTPSTEYSKAAISFTGNAQPDFIYGWSNSFAYKNLDFNFFIRGVSGNQILNATMAGLNSPGDATTLNIPQFSLIEAVNDNNSYIISERFRKIRFRRTAPRA
ncbi:MAG: hypothetical protein EOP51_30945 [Sphingobacteriales bacterium]|nr:MAG: hypothetical protein EOP51_30945 [Sphingobacteriales bacterium]